MAGVVVVEEAPTGLDPQALLQRLNTKGCGAVVSFIGITRETEGEADVLRLEFDAWQDKLQPVLKQLAKTAIEIHGVRAVAMAIEQEVSVRKSPSLLFMSPALTARKRSSPASGSLTS